MDSDARILELEAKIAELSAVVDRIASHDDASLAEHVPMPQATSSRRNMLKLAGAAAVGAVAAAAGSAHPAAADDPNDVTLSTSKTSTASTVISYIGGTTPSTNIFTAHDGVTGSFYPAGLGGYATGTRVNTGVYGYSSGDNAGVVAYANGNAAVGLRAVGSSRANVLLDAQGAAGPLRAVDHSEGEVVCDSNADLWYCVAAGNPGTWVRLAGPSTSGSLQLLATPTRVYDSRANTLPAVDPKTPLTNLVSRTIDCKANSSGVPAGARGVLLNVTVIAISPNGFLAVTPGGAGFTGTSTLNWSAAGAVIANSATSACGTAATIDVTAGGGGTTDVIVDVFGYYL
jgi:hypothetical protein